MGAFSSVQAYQGQLDLLIGQKLRQLKKPQILYGGDPERGRQKPCTRMGSGSRSATRRREGDFAGSAITA